MPGQGALDPMMQFLAREGDRPERLIWEFPLHCLLKDPVFRKALWNTVIFTRFSRLMPHSASTVLILS